MRRYDFSSAQKGFYKYYSNYKTSSVIRFSNCFEKWDRLQDTQLIRRGQEMRHQNIFSQYQKSHYSNTVLLQLQEIIIEWNSA